ncbi:MAG: hypothetical protein J5842_05715, partial [Lachnospiraceae bacterium]|nr:hypothetical protein [Lachnospiraceae bacterium]
IYCMRQESDNVYIYTIDATIEDPAGFGDEAEITDALLSAGGGNADVDKEPYEDEWGKHYTAYSPVLDSSGKVVGIVGVDFSAEWFDQQIVKHVSTIILIAVIILICSIIAVLFITSRIKKGFNTLNRKICDIADGSGDLSKEIEMYSGDEFEVIAGNMNLFIAQIRDIINGVKNSVEGSVASTDELSIIAEHASDTMRNLSEAITGVSAGATQQAEDVSSAAYNVSQIVTSLSSMSETIDKAEECTGSMTRNSEGVSKSFDELIDAIHDSMQELEQVTKEMSGVGASVDTVIQAADVINQIASQTNLLSLNASIEAARAGDAGRGFAVVAGEIGTLAYQSNNSAASIKQVMDELKVQTGKAIELVNQLNAVMAEQETSSSASKEYLKTLFEDINNTKENFDIIRNDATQIRSACDVMNNTIESLSAISQENAASAEMTAGSVNEIVGIIGTVSHKADSIKQLSGDLGNMVSSYNT